MANLTEAEYDLLVYLEQYYWTHSTLPSVEFADENLGLDRTLYSGALKKELFRESLIDRGIPRKVLAPLLPDGIDGDVPSWKQYSLTETQLLCANAVLDSTDNRSRRKKLSELGISTQDYERWMRDPVFSGYLRNRAESLLSDSQHEAHLALIDRVRSGDINAVKYYNEITGRYVPASSRASGGNNFDTRMILLRVVEVVQRHCDPAQIKAIASELGELVDGGLGSVSSGSPNINGGVVRGQIEQSERQTTIQKERRTVEPVIREVSL